MEYSTLHELINFLEYGTRLHIGVLFFDFFDSEALKLDDTRRIHTGDICWFFKNLDGGTQKCYRCRKAAIRKAQRECRDFGGCCINGVYEYTHPIVIDNHCAAIVYIGNILPQGKLHKRLERETRERPELLDTLERDFDEEKCRALGTLIESYIRALQNHAPKKKDAKETSSVENIKSYIDASLEFDIRLTDVAQTFHYNPQYLGRLFKTKTGMSFAEYINYRRVTHAAEYLKTNLNVTTIALNVGFNSVTYFNRVFKRYFGISPTEYRKGWQKKG